MATILLAAAGAAVGSSVGGTVLGLSGAVIGRAVGATVGRVIDQRLLGMGSDPVEVGRIDRFRIMGASEGTPIPTCWGNVRLAAQVIWASPYRETRSTTGGGKGTPTPKTTTYSYSVSLALALCEGAILGIGRIWADGEEISSNSVDMRIYPGDEEQRPDPAIEADVGVEFAPSYRGTAYVVLENLALERFGNRVPQFSFEVFRTANIDGLPVGSNFQSAIKAVALIPGTGEYSLETRRARISTGFAETQPLNVSSPFGETDFSRSLAQMERELPQCEAVSLVVCWFGDDLRCNHCKVQPKVESQVGDAIGLPWRSGGLSRSEALELPRVEGRPIYGGTPSDASIIECLRELSSAGKAVMFYPFVLMEQLPGNSLTDPYSETAGQPAFPWRGRITLSVAPGLQASPDGTETAINEVRAFFGNAEPTDFSVDGEIVSYSGAAEDWGYRRFILHYAHLCKLAGGVEAFCIGSELRGLTQIMGPDRSFPAVMEFVRLVQDVREILGAGVKLSYAADWSEYFGYQRGNEVYFHLDDLWGSPEIDFVGIDNYMPISDWRYGDDHADADWGSVHNLDYLKSGIAGGEGYDWFYASPEARDSQARTAIADTAYGEDWVFRPKDLVSWWSESHFERHDGVRQALPTSWIPKSKPIRFTEYGCPAVDLGTNSPNRFSDPRSSESALPYFSRGIGDAFLQMQYFRAVSEFWQEPSHNPNATLYAGKMVDLDRCYAWAWDARPYPDFPSNLTLWADGLNHHLGHWLNGRASAQPLDLVIREICSRNGVEDVVTEALYGGVKGYVVQDALTARAQIQPLSTAYGFDAAESEGLLEFLTRPTRTVFEIDPDTCVLSEDKESQLSLTRLSDADVPSHVRLSYVLADGSHDTKIAEAKLQESADTSVFQTEYALTLSRAEAASIVENWLISARASRDAIEIGLPPSRTDVLPGTNIKIRGAEYRVDRVEIGESRSLEAVRIERNAAASVGIQGPEEMAAGRNSVGPVTAIWMDLPHITGSEPNGLARIAASAKPWPGSVGVWSAPEDNGYELIKLLERSSTVGVTQSPLAATPIATLDRGAALRVKIVSGSLASVSPLAHFNGSNLAAIGDGTPDGWEIFSFRDAELVGGMTYDLRTRLRGLSGTTLPQGLAWPIGSLFVLLDSDVGQFEIPTAFFGLDRHYRVAPFELGYADAEAQNSVVSFRGISNRPYGVVHLKSEVGNDGSAVIQWVRQTRIGGDSWEQSEVPLSEEREAYVVQIRALDGTILFQEETAVPSFTYSADRRGADGTVAGFQAEIAQLSPSFGPGPSRTITVGPGAS